MINELSVGSIILFEQEIKSVPRYESISQILSLDSQIDDHHRYLDGRHLLPINDNWEYTYGIANLSISQTLSLIHLVERVKFGSVTHWLNFAERFISCKFAEITHTLNLTQSYNSPGKLITSPLSLTQTIITQLIYSRTVGQTLSFISSPNSRYFAESQTYLPTESTVTFTYGSQVLTLRSPEFEDVEEVNLHHIERYTRAKGLSVCRESFWPMENVLKMTFNYLKESEKQALVNFLRYSCGQEVTFVDYENREWTGIILNPVGNITQNERAGYTAKLDFEGVLS